MIEATLGSLDFFSYLCTMKKLIIIYIILAAVILYLSVTLKSGIMCFEYETTNCHKCLSNDYNGL